MREEVTLQFEAHLLPSHLDLSYRIRIGTDRAIYDKDEEIVCSKVRLE
jgi:hypothetical protein